MVRTVLLHPLLMCIYSEIGQKLNVFYQSCPAMSKSEKFCLNWNEYEENIVKTFCYLREDTDFVDVTLACEDGHQMEAHKTILASSSPVFKNLLQKNKHTHPLIYMRGMKSADLAAIVDFLYDGEANIYQEHLESFLSIAEELKLKGLTERTKNMNVPKRLIHLQMKNLPLKQKCKSMITTKVWGTLKKKQTLLTTMKG